MNPNDGEVIISVQHIDKFLGGKPVLRDLSVDVKQGESLVIVGGSGQGKSVTLKHMIGLMHPDEGHVYVLGEDICCLEAREMNRFRRHFGMAFQEGALFDSMNVFENIAFPLRRHTEMTEEQIHARVRECLEQVHLHGVAMLYNGHIVEQGTPYEFQESSNPIVRQFIEGRAEGPLTE